MVPKQLADLVQPTTDVDTTVRQVFQSRTDEVPNFPYTETPMLPPEVYRKGLSSREKLQELPGMDPIFVVKTPTLFRTRPTGVKLPADCLRSTWILVHGKWEQVEDRVPPLFRQMDRKGMLPVSLPHFRSDCLTARMCIQSGQLSVPMYVDVGTEQSEPHIQY